jgi:glycosyltransferase involved in cell wall biosynthesis
MTSDTPLVSIVVTTFNVGPFIGQCLDGLVRQTLDNIEIIVVDDASTDNTKDIIRDYAVRDSRIRTIFFEKNTIGGVASAANAGIDAAAGKYVGFADGDDVYASDMFELLVNAAESRQADIALCNYYLLDQNNGRLSPPADDRHWQQIGEVLELDYDGKLRLLPFIAVPWRKLYRRDLLGEAIRFPVVDYFFEDNPFHWFVTLSAKRAVFVDKKLCFHRVNRPGQSMATVDRRLFRMFDHADTIYDWLDKRGALAQYRHVLLGWIVSQLEWITGRLTPELRSELFAKLRAVTKRFNSQDMTNALRYRSMGINGTRLLEAIMSGNESDFSTAIEKKGKSGQLTRITHHIRRYGMVSLLRKASARIMRGRSVSVLPGRTETDLSDVVASLRILDQRLSRIEKLLADSNPPKDR